MTLDWFSSMQFYTYNHTYPAVNTIRKVLQTNNIKISYKQESQTYVHMKHRITIHPVRYMIVLMVTLNVLIFLAHIVVTTHRFPSPLNNDKNVSIFFFQLQCFPWMVLYILTVFLFEYICHISIITVSQWIITSKNKSTL